MPSNSGGRKSGKISDKVGIFAQSRGHFSADERARHCPVPRRALPSPRREGGESPDDAGGTRG